MPKSTRPTLSKLKRQGAELSRQRAKLVQQRNKQIAQKQQVQGAINRTNQQIKEVDQKQEINTQHIHQSKLRHPLSHPIYNIRNRPFMPKTRTRVRKASNTIKEWAGAFFFFVGVIGVIGGLTSLQSTSGGEAAPSVPRRTAIVSGTGGIGVKHRDAPDTAGIDGGPQENDLVELLHYTVGWWEVVEPDGRRGFIENQYLMCNKSDCTTGILDSER